MLLWNQISNSKLKILQDNFVHNICTENILNSRNRIGSYFGNLTTCKPPPFCVLGEACALWSNCIGFKGQKFGSPVATHDSLFCHAIIPPMSPPPPSPPIWCSRCIIDAGDNVACCSFVRATDPLHHWCHFLVLGPGEWHQHLTMTLRCHGGWRWDDGVPLVPVETPGGWLLCFCRC